MFKKFQTAVIRLFLSSLLQSYIHKLHLIHTCSYYTDKWKYGLIVPHVAMCRKNKWSSFKNVFYSSFEATNVLHTVV
jgi:hypothetical protein